MKLYSLVTIKILHKNNKKELQKRISDNTQENVKDRLWLFIIFLFIGVLFVDVLISPNKITTPHVTRFDYYLKYSKLSFITYYISLFIDYLFCIDGIIFVNSTKSKNIKLRNISILFLLIAILYKYLIGVEFMGFVYLGVSFAIPILMNLKLKDYNFFTMKNIVLVTLLLTLALVPKITFFNNSKVYKGVANTAIEKFMYRALALQGEVWWGTDKYCKFNRDSSNDISQVKNEIKSLINDNDRFKAGIWYLSYLIIPNINHKDNLATLNCGHPAILIAIFGYLGAVFAQILCGIIFSVMTVALKREIEQKHYCSVFFSYAIWYMTYTSFCMGGIWYFGGSTMKISLLCLIVCEIYNYLLKYRKKEKYHNFERTY